MNHFIFSINEQLLLISCILSRNAMWPFFGPNFIWYLGATPYKLLVLLIKCSILTFSFSFSHAILYDIIFNVTP
jgi:hypothetical protein